MSLDKRKKAFIKLGEFLSQFQTTGNTQKEDIDFNDLFFDAFSLQIKRAKEFNSWFTENNVYYSLNSWSKALTEDNLNQWLSNYNFSKVKPETIAVIMAGNIPLVGFHDFLSVLITGHSVLAKLSSNDKYFLPLIAKYLEYIEPDFKGKIAFTEDKLEGYDAVIATGSNNTARYFEYYFGKKRNIIRKNRNAVAVLDGNETPEQLEALMDDVFTYFGLGCRSIAKIFIPRGYDFDKLFTASMKYQDLIGYPKYKNNYDYNKAVYLMSLFDVKENGLLLLKEDLSYSSPIASLFYEYYDDINILSNKLKDEKEQIQCISSELPIDGAINLGNTQKPKLWDYADGVDTIEFLLHN